MASKAVKKVPARPAAASKKKVGGKAVNGSQKGAAFERSIAKQFSLWISEGANPDLLWRSAGSGGRSTQRRKQTGRGIEYHASDIAPLHPDAGPFVDVFTLECKNYRAIELRQVVYDWKASTIAKWWAQASRDARSVNRISLMVIKENLKPVLLVMPHPGGKALETCVLEYTVVDGFVDRVIIIDLLQVLSRVPFKTFRSFYVPGSRDDRPAPHRQPTRRVQVAGVRSSKRTALKV